jgi:hypothetical protein
MSEMSEKYYKILTDNLIHKNFKYELGLNIDHEPFKPYGSCNGGGLYFTNKTNLHKFLEYGVFIGDIKIPKDARIYKNSDNDDKWKADKVILEAYCPIEDHDLMNDETFVESMIKYNAKYFKYLKNASNKICVEAVRQKGQGRCWDRFQERCHHLPI